MSYTYYLHRPGGVGGLPSGSAMAALAQATSKGRSKARLFNGLFFATRRCKVGAEVTAQR